MRRIVQEGLKTYCVGSSGYTDYFYRVEYKTIRSNRIPGLIPVQVREKDNDRQVYYEITGKRSLESLASESAFSHARCRMILTELIDMTEKLEDYLLEPDYVCYDPGYVYISGQHLFWLYGMTSERPVQEEVEDFLSFLLSKVDYDDSDAVHFVYQIFWVVRKQGFSIDLVKEVLIQDRQGGGREDHQKSESYEDFFKKNRKDQSEVLPDPDALSSDESSLKTEEETGEIACKAINWPGLIISIILFLFFSASVTGAGIMLSYGMERGLTDKGIAVIILCFAGALISAVLWVYLPGGHLPGKRQQKKDDKKEDEVESEKWYSQTAGNQDSTPAKEHFPDTSRKSSEKTSSDRSENIVEGHGEEESMKKMRSDEVIFPWKPGESTGDKEGTIILSQRKRNCPILKSIENGDLTLVREFPFYIGSDPVLNQMVLIDKTISRQHAVILQGKKKDSYRIKDLGSTNGTWIRGKQVNSDRPDDLEEGDIVCFAQKKYRFLINRDML